MKKPDCDLTRSLDGVVDEESAEKTDSDEEVIEDAVEEGIPGPEEADMLNNQELEGDCILVGICWRSLITHLYLQKYQHPEQGGDVGLDP